MTRLGAIPSRLEKMPFNRKSTYWLPVILVMLFIFWMSTDLFSSKHTSLIIEPLIRFFAPHLSRKEMTHIHDILRKLAHVTEYFILGTLLFRAFRAGSGEPQWWRWGLSSLAVVLCYAGADELHQLLVSSRTASFVDVGIDTLGGVLAQGVSIIGCRRRQTRDG